jgi:hypothetical protein
MGRYIGSSPENNNGISSGVFSIGQVSRRVSELKWPSAEVAFIEYLIIAGGGGGATCGDNGVGGGGGAGGLLTNTMELTRGTEYTITIGAGGASKNFANTDDYGNAGSDTTAFGLTAIGGGNGGRWLSAGDQSLLNAGGSGGGGGGRNGTTGGNGTAGQGNNGGNATLSTSASSDSGGGGGGAGSVGGNAASYEGGHGGDGAYSNITGTITPYAGGGGGGTEDGKHGGHGGIGGGGKGGEGTSTGRSSAESRATDGEANTGGGGGGASGSSEANNYGAAGGSGVVIVRSYSQASATTGTPTATTFDDVEGTNYVYKFTGSGSITF